MMESSGPQETLYQFDQLVKASVEILVPVMKKFTLNYHGADEPSGQEYSITLDVLQNPGMCGSTPYLPLRMTMGSGDNTDLVSRCFDVLKGRVHHGQRGIGDRLPGWRRGVREPVRPPGAGQLV